MVSEAQQRKETTSRPKWSQSLPPNKGPEPGLENEGPTASTGKQQGILFQSGSKRTDNIPSNTITPENQVVKSFKLQKVLNDLLVNITSQQQTNQRTPKAK